MKNKSNTESPVKGEVVPQAEKIRALIDREKWDELTDVLDEWPVPDIADLLLKSTKSERVFIFRALEREKAAEVFAFLDPYPQNTLLKELTDNETRKILKTIPPDDRTQFLEELPARLTRKLLNLLEGEHLEEARELLGYPEESVGRLMTPDYVRIKPDWTCQEALEHIRKIGKDKETIKSIYVVDEENILIDAISLRQIILTDPETQIEEIMDYSYVSAKANADREEAVKIMQRYDLFSIPVEDSNGRLLGIVTMDDALDVAEEEATEDFQKTSAVLPLGKTYSEAGVGLLFRSRFWWLLILVFVNLISSGIIAGFEETLEAAIGLAFFIPLLIDSGGNAGAQSAMMMVRAISIGDVQMDEWFKAFLREIAIGLFLGLSLGFASFFLGVFRAEVMIGVVVGLAMLVIIFAANLIGVLLPFLLTTLNLDPAVASGPLITSIVDACGLLIYFSIAMALL